MHGHQIFPLSVFAPILAVGMLLVSCGGHEVRDDRRPLCFLSRPTEDGQPVRPVSAEEWMRLMLASGSLNGTASATCQNEPISWHLPTNCANGMELGDEPQPVPLVRESVITRRVSPTENLVWIRTHQYANGERLGPMALVETTPQGLVVRTLGVLRTREERLRVKMGASGNVLIAEGETCTDDHDPSTCTRLIRFLPVTSDHFRAGAINNEEGRCLSPASFEPTKTTTITLDNGWARKFVLAASYEEKGEGIVIHEQVTISDSDPRHAEVPPRPFRMVDGDRHLRISGDSLVSDSLPLWDRALREHGATTIPPDGGVAATSSAR